MYNFLFCLLGLTVLVLGKVLGSGDEAHEEGRRAFHRAFQLGVELAAYKERMGRQFDHFHKAGLRVITGSYEAGLFHLVQEVVIKLVTMAVTFADSGSAAIDS